MKKLLVTAAILTLVGCSKVNIENYNKVTVGMDKTEIEAILGSADNCEEKTLHTNCIWGNEDQHIKVTLVSEKVTLYTQKGLK
ncbi:hypothetical protein PSECIP111951_02311 [Pseudoalteromonas holothuriae]|uniref:DUF3862 domain-containing protein n=1 Tax=Pseudoalteromonas holothuriae TaxID=2963714 RepID=A0A9W4QZU0_9GAMM|nr:MULTISPECIES: outer membrane protein assembly factor BamE [unclassified Pseudoalteromonas]CAH9060581.1 hypothetical protein PSECIP111951_02311 [Pseudoalteromonas sp. CIP111951]CAH9060754.1 hypothetical protein PSECIP111854_02671 [Pseudoalteromonas sp. CIP111854]